MTKHNLTGHLSWLLKSNNAVLNNDAPAIVQSSQTAGLLDTLALSQSAPGTQGNVAVESDGRAFDVAGFPPTEREFLRPTLPASFLTAQDGVAMARLGLGSTSSNKPCLLSENIPVSLQTPASIARVPGTSLREHYTTRYEHRSEGKCYLDNLPCDCH